MSMQVNPDKGSGQEVLEHYQRDPLCQTFCRGEGV